MKMLVKEIEVTVQLTYRVQRENSELPPTPREHAKVVDKVVQRLNYPTHDGEIRLRASDIRADAIKEYVPETK